MLECFLSALMLSIVYACWVQRVMPKSLDNRAKMQVSLLQGCACCVIIARANEVCNLVCLQLASWEHAINNAAAAIDKHLLSTVFSKYSFVKHCNALKRYLLLGQGDFIQTLMDLLGPHLGKKAQDMSEYQLNGSLDAAIRASNAQFDDADVLDRLRVKLAKPTAMETGQLTVFTDISDCV